MALVASNHSTHKPILLIDASIYIFQYYFSLPDNWFSEEEQWPTAAVYGYSAFLARLLKTEQPQRIAACFDESLEQCFRNEIYPDYKASRALPDEALAFQLKGCREITELMGIACFSSTRYEADDLLGSLYQSCQRSKQPIAILTRDKDLGQLLKRPQDFLWDYSSKNKTQSYADDITQKFGVRPDQLADYLALVGDSIDDIPGVPGIGAKTASRLLEHFGTIDALYQQLHTLPELALRGAKRIQGNLDEYREQVGIARQLAEIVTNLDLIQSVTELERHASQSASKESIEDFCYRMGFPRLAKTLSEQLR